MTNETNKPLAETKQALSETKQLRGTFDQVIRQINETYNASNGWAIARTSSVLVNFSVWLERSVKQAETLEKAVATEVKAESQAKPVSTKPVETTQVESATKTVTKRTTTKK